MQTVNGRRINPAVNTFVDGPFTYSFDMAGPSDARDYNIAFPAAYVGGSAGPADLQANHTFTWAGGPWGWSRQLCTSAKSGQFSGSAVVYDATCSLSIDDTSLKVRGGFVGLHGLRGPLKLHPVTPAALAVVISSGVVLTSLLMCCPCRCLAVMRPH